MIHRVRFRLTYSSVAATVALFVALGGGAYAAVTFPANSVGTKQIQNNSVVAAKIKKNAVTSAKVLDNSLTGADIQEGSLANVPSALHANSSGALDKVTYKTATGTAPNGQTSGSATAACDPGQHVISGGVKVNDLINGLLLDEFPDAANTAWTARVGAVNVDVAFTVYAVCTSVTATG